MVESQPAPCQRIYRRRPDEGAAAFGEALPEEPETTSSVSRAA
jgi:hypothetical protein